MAPHFLSLPRELRQMVYDILLLDRIEYTDMFYHPCVQAGQLAHLTRQLYPNLQIFQIYSVRKRAAYRSPAYNLSLVCKYVREELLARCQQSITRGPRHELSLYFIGQPHYLRFWETVLMEWNTIPLFPRPDIDVLHVNISTLSLWSLLLPIYNTNMGGLWDIISSTVLFGPRPRCQDERLPPQTELSFKYSIGTLRLVYDGLVLERRPFRCLFPHGSFLVRLNYFLELYPALCCIKTIELHASDRTIVWDVKESLQMHFPLADVDKEIETIRGIKHIMTDEENSSINVPHSSRPSNHPGSKVVDHRKRHTILGKIREALVKIFHQL